MTTAEREQIDRWLGGMLAQIQREFFRGKTDSEFYQERNLLLQAIACPADWLKQRGIHKMPLADYRRILQTVLEAIREHGRRAKIRRFSAYFLHSVQRHMQIPRRGLLLRGKGSAQPRHAPAENDAPRQNRRGAERRRHRRPPGSETHAAQQRRPQTRHAGDRRAGPVQTLSRTAAAALHGPCRFGRGDSSNLCKVGAIQDFVLRRDPPARAIHN
jgi:hypothetical protein